MRLLLILASGANLIFAAAFGLYIRMQYVTSRPKPAYFISLPGVVLLCVDGQLDPGWRTLTCSRVDGSPKAGDGVHIESFSGPTLPMSNVNDS